MDDLPLIPDLSTKQLLALAILERGPRSPQSLMEEMQRHAVLKIPTYTMVRAFGYALVSRKFARWDSHERVLFVTDLGLEMVDVMRLLLRKEGGQ